MALRCLSIILRQENTGSASEAKSAILASVVMAKEAVAQDTKDGISWTVLGNAYLCQFFMVKQDPATLKLCMSAYKQAWSDPIARGQPDLYYNKGVVSIPYYSTFNKFMHERQMLILKKKYSMIKMFMTRNSKTPFLCVP